MSMMHHSVATSGAALVQSFPANVLADNGFPVAASATYNHNAFGSVTTQINGGTATTLGTWLLFGAAADYEVRMTMQSGTNFAGSALSTWLAANSNRSWNQTLGAIGTATGTGLLEIRRVSTGTILGSATVTLTATVEG